MLVAGPCADAPLRLLSPHQTQPPARAVTAVAGPPQITTRLWHPVERTPGHSLAAPGNRESRARRDRSAPARPGCPGAGSRRDPAAPRRDRLRGAGRADGARGLPGAIPWDRVLPVLAPGGRCRQLPARGAGG